MTVTEFLDIVKQNDKYIEGSLYLKSGDNYGCVYKYLVLTPGLFASRREVFIELTPEESELELGNKTVISSIEVYPAR